jgi:hypothetical protein
MKKKTNEEKILEQNNEDKKIDTSRVKYRGYNSIVNDVI